MIKKHLFSASALAGLWAVYYLTGIPCPILLLAGIPCPACGSTRAVLALLQGDIAGYLQYQPMALPLALSVIICIHIRAVKKPYNRLAVSFAAATLFANTVLYIFRLVNLFMTTEIALKMI